MPIPAVPSSLHQLSPSPSAPEVSSKDIEHFRSFYGDSSAFAALPAREQEIICFLDTICPLQDGPEQTIDVCLGVFAHSFVWEQVRQGSLIGTLEKIQQ